jgi:protein-L-isoaspartate(D-aspartate) O-methyltransferase
MLEKDIIPRGVKDERVLEALRTVPRHLFVDDNQRMNAYEDHPLPIGEGQTISQPYIVASMTEALKLDGSETVLEIGTGSGYQTAILAELAGRVYSVERVPSLTGKSRKVLDSLGYNNVLIKLSDGTLGWEEYAPYDRILVTAGAPSIPEPLTDQLRPGGILVIPVGSNTLQELTRVTKGEDGTLTEERLGSCVFVRLVGKHGWEAGR